MAHIVWDWNGTLFDDIEAVVGATNEIFASYGVRQLDVAGFRAVYTRPIWVCYERIVGRPLEGGEWERLNTAFHDSYDRLRGGCGLAAGARAALDLLAAAGHTQSLLSMYYHEPLVAMVERLGLGGAFRRVDGLRPEQAGATKGEFLGRHLTALGVAGGDVIMIGDSADDALAAASNGARAVCYTGGMQSLADLHALGVPLVDRLSDLARHV